jgi:hypothetical protein
MPNTEIHEKDSCNACDPVIGDGKRTEGDQKSRPRPPLGNKKTMRQAVHQKSFEGGT